MIASTSVNGKSNNDQYPSQLSKGKVTMITTLASTSAKGVTMITTLVPLSKGKVTMITTLASTSAKGKSNNDHYPS